MSERKLAMIRVISDIKPIEGADKIEQLIIDGWSCVARKGEFKINDTCIFLEIDSIVPPLIVYDFLAPRKYRVKTIKLKKTISQGVALPLEEDDGALYINEKHIPSNIKYNPLDYDFKVGDDLTKLLGITKHLSKSEQEEYNQVLSKKKHNWFIRYMTRFQWFRKLFKRKSKSFPEWLEVTDKERLQNMPWALKDKTDTYWVSEKIDYQSASYWYKRKKLFGIINKDEFGICSRTVRKFEMDNSIWSQAARELNIRDKLKGVGKNIAIQGELGSIKTQGNKYGLTGFKLFVFDVFDIDKERYYNYNEIMEFCNQYGFDIVPAISYDFKLLDTVEEMVELSKGNSRLIYRSKELPREGLVFVSITNRKKAFKVINPDFLLYFNE